MHSASTMTSWDRSPHDVGHFCSRLSQRPIMVSRISSAPARPARWLSPASSVQLCFRQPRHHVRAVGERDDVVRVAVPPPDRHLDLIDAEPPVPGEEEDVGEGGGERLRPPLSRSSRNIALNSGRASRGRSPSGEVGRRCRAPGTQRRDEADQRGGCQPDGRHRPARAPAPTVEPRVSSGHWRCRPARGVGGPRHRAHRRPPPGRAWRPRRPACTAHRRRAR